MGNISKNKTKEEHRLVYEYSDNLFAIALLKIDYVSKSYTIEITSKAKRSNTQDYSKAKKKVYKKTEKLAKKLIKK